MDITKTDKGLHFKAILDGQIFRAAIALFDETEEGGLEQRSVEAISSDIRSLVIDETAKEKAIALLT
nr:hypothetical protein [uncultured Cohaesibacter sp.]